MGMNEQLIKFAKEQCEIFPEDSDMGMYLRETIKILQAEPCEDAISREKLEKLKKWRFSYDTNTTIPKSDLFVRLEDIRAVSHVTPTRKKGKWERGYSFPDGEYVKCTVCGEIIKCIYPMHYCPNCGAEMESKE